MLVNKNNNKKIKQIDFTDLEAEIDSMALDSQWNKTIFVKFLFLLLETLELLFINSEFRVVLKNLFTIG